jgi:hypothetical protein
MAPAEDTSQHSSHQEDEDLFIQCLQFSLTQLPYVKAASIQNRFSSLSKEEAILMIQRMEREGEN